MCKKLAVQEETACIHYALFFKHEDRSYHLHNIMSIEDEHHRLYKYKSMNEAAEFFDCASMCHHRKLLEFFKEFTPNCKNNCDICTATTPLHIAQDCTVIARSILDGIKDINAVTDKISVKLLAQVLFGSSAAAIKSLGLDRSRVYGSAKSYYRERIYLSSIGYWYIDRRTHWNS